MTKREVEDIAESFDGFLELTNNADGATVANSAIDMVKEIMNKYPKIRKYVEGLRKEGK